ncbi:MAG: CRISPR-associated helicase/endonuclease Cas3 [Gammaproteobacteria bacterium]|nr:CRISPR-associated helicase/endonuclease Cas3 [Gammaproteobacteria bacterium]
MDIESYFKYWGKASKENDSYHLLPYHCLDVAAVASVWWDQSISLRNQFAKETGLDTTKTRALILFFVALHDLGKFDVRFQLKAPEVIAACWPEFTEDAADYEKSYYHGVEGYMVFRRQILKQIELNFDSLDPWLKAVCGHHGDMNFQGVWHEPDADDWVIEHDKKTRYDWLQWLIDFFLKPANINLIHPLPNAPSLLAGFCSVCDWIGSNSTYFIYQSEIMELEKYWYQAKVIAQPLVNQMGLQQNLTGQNGMKDLFPGYQPRQLQTLVENLPVESGLTIIEAPTGSGKTETALAYASKLLNAGLADSIIFALPTQATANAMLGRLERVATSLFDDGANLVLAHGKARFNTDFERIKQASRNNDVQTNDQERAAQVQCVQWLGESRKRVFLGQIGVCTIDQVLVSVLPVRHNFVRQFGINKSILIIDEVHAYDAYMYGLLTSVLQRQHQASGSALLLSATLPLQQKKQLLDTYEKIAQNDTLSNIQPYPLISHVSHAATIQHFVPAESEQPPSRLVEVEQIISQDILPDETLIHRIINAANQGALVGLVCNLVADAQQLHHRIVAQCNMQNLNIPIDLFHARFCFADRQQHEGLVIKHYGKEADRGRGRILVATQVIEQSLDLDFDWLLTQICPVDLLFQRLGRLHRHPRDNRPSEYTQPKVTVLVPETNDFGLHQYVYATARFLWRTRELLQEKQIHFPGAYRDWIEKVYDEQAWPDEPDEIIQSHDEYWIKCSTARQFANRIANTDYKPFSDTEDKVALMTRDGDMNLNVLLMQNTSEAILLDGRKLSELDDWEYFEALQMNTVSVPRSWEKLLPGKDREELIKLPMGWLNEQWQWQQEKTLLTYHPARGLERFDHEPVNG